MFIKRKFTARTICLLFLAGFGAAVHAQKTATEPVSDDKDVTTEEHSDDHHPFPPKSKREATEIDSWIIAEKYNWGIKETRQHMVNQDKFSDLVYKIATKHGDVFAASAMASKPGENATIWVKGKGASEINKQVEQFNGRSDMKVKIVDGMRFSYAEQEARMSAISEILEGQGMEGIGSAMLPGDVIVVSLPASKEYPETPKPEDPDRMKFDGRHVDPVAEKLLGKKIDVRGIYFVFTNQPIDVDLHARGGRLVYGASGCTSGFSVERISDSLNGIATAAHCTGVNNFDAESPEADFSLSHRGEHCSTHGDLEWKSSGHFELAEYWASPTDLRDVNSRENWYSVNNTYCIYSRVTGTRTCDQVYSASVSQGSSSAGICNGGTAKKLVAMDDENGVPGDSGGPWSYSTEAAGIVKGTKWIWFGTRATFSKTSRLDEALGVRVRIQ
ncbi:MAG: hypothetical protein HKN85_07655 [Gammaproteobacteria bacterium]|nr:hypothetical protein [Gammaproteobacteria bacterium]